jgi:hypothetical protein
MRGTITTGAVRIPSSHALWVPASPPVVSQNRATSAGVSRTRKAQPWVKPALGARWACASIRSTIAGSTGSSE